jgi:hypothetical protein
MLLPETLQVGPQGRLDKKAKGGAALWKSKMNSHSQTLYLPCKIARMHRYLLAFTLLLLSACAFAQQDYVGRYDIYTGYSYLESPSINLAERGFHVQAGVNRKMWYALGFDYSWFNGHTSLTPNNLQSSVQTQLASQLGQLAAAGLIPSTYQLAVPIDSTTQTFAAGPQFTYRHFKTVTLFIRPSVGAIRETAVPHPRDPIAGLVVSQLAPSGQKLDWTGFYGFGGGFDLNMADHIGLRVQADFVHDHLFNDLLNGRNSVRVSLGPTFRFGRNIAQGK